MSPAQGPAMEQMTTGRRGAPRWHRRAIVVALAGLSVACVADGADRGNSDPTRGLQGSGKADYTIFLPAIFGGGASDPGDCQVTACANADECDVSQPYCDRSTGYCRQTPPDCETDAECAEPTPHCWPSGECVFERYLNCSPGWGPFEGICDNPRCPDPEACPTGTAIDPASCLCLPEPGNAAPACEDQSDCNAAYPYCDRATAHCRQTASQCVSSDDCAAPTPHCWPTGECEIERYRNCRPGFVPFEDTCDNPAGFCPPGTVAEDGLCIPIECG